MKLWAVIKREYLERVQTRWFSIATVFGPLLLGGMLFLPSYLASRERASADVSRIHILDATGTDLGRLIATELNGGVFGDTSQTRVLHLEPSQVAQAESLATQAVRAREIKGYLVLDARVFSGSRPRYAGVNATALADLRRLEGVVSREMLAMELRRSGLSPADVNRLKGYRVGLTAERLTATGRGGAARVNFLFAITVAALLYMMILMYGQSVLRGVVEEKQARVSEVVVAAVRPRTLLAGKVLGVGAVGLTQMVIWAITAVVMLRYRVPMLQALGLEARPLPMPTITATMLVTLAAFFLLGYTLYSALFAAVGATVSSDQEAQQAQIPVVMALVVSMIFLQPILSAPNGRLATVLGLLPFTSPIVMPLRLSASDVPLWEIGLSLVLLAAACVAILYFAALLYRAGLLVYGRQLSLRDIGRAMRGV